MQIREYDPIAMGNVHGGKRFEIGGLARSQLTPTIVFDKVSLIKNDKRSDMGQDAPQVAEIENADAVVQQAVKIPRLTISMMVVLFMVAGHIENPGESARLRRQQTEEYRRREATEAEKGKAEEFRTQQQAIARGNRAKSKAEQKSAQIKAEYKAGKIKAERKAAGIKAEEAAKIETAKSKPAAKRTPSEKAALRVERARRKELFAIRQAEIHRKSEIRKAEQLEARSEALKELDRRAAERDK